MLQLLEQVLTLYLFQKIETLARKSRTKTVVPVRDSEVAQIPTGVLDLIRMKFPIATARLLEFLGFRVAQSNF